MKLPKLVIDSFRRNCHAKIKKIEAFIAEHEDIDLTSAKLEKLKRLNTALKEQWGRMEAAWYEHDPTVSNEDAEVLMELDEIVTATEKAVGGVLETSEQFIKERLTIRCRARVTQTVQTQNALTATPTTQKTSLQMRKSVMRILIREQNKHLLKNSVIATMGTKMSVYEY